MGVRVALHHRTSYEYDRLVRLSPHIVRLRPAPHCRTAVSSYTLKVQPREHFLNWQQDPHGNYLARLVFPEPSQALVVDVDLVAELTVFNPFDFFLEDHATYFPFRYEPDALKDLAPYLVVDPPGPRMEQYLQGISRNRAQIIDYIVAVNAQLNRDIEYRIRMEPGVQTCEETLTNRSGSCRDSAWLLVQILRNLGMAARFVSGYLIQLVPDEKPLDGPAGASHDFSDLHAWAEVYLPGAGWVGLDPTSGLLAGEGHLPLASTPDPVSAAPITGSTDKTETHFTFDMSVRRVYESPRVTRPFSSEQWAAIDLLGETVDQTMARLGVGLTMGGEPTFVSMEDRDGPAWHTEALGEGKYNLAFKLFERLSKHFASAPLHHLGQGKWYPGEPLPRWSMDCYWAKDGTPLWREPRWMANPLRDYRMGAEDARAFARNLANRLGVGAERAMPAYEDAFYYLWKERQLPINTDPFDSKLEDPLERKRLCAIFERGLDAVTGMALPLRAVPAGASWRWESTTWKLRANRLYLLPGDSAMGFRLPLDSLLHEPAGKREEVLMRDPMGLPRGMAAAPLRIPAPDGGNGMRAEQPLPGRDESESPRDRGIIRTTLCVEPRQGRLHVFMPPMESSETYFTLIHAVEDTAAALEMPVIVEGYPPPFDPRVTKFSIQPDPGVVEVNIQPAANWAELRAISETLYEEARQCRLSAEKFGLDGRATGTGGGSHIVLGGATPAESPFLRRPDVLRSMLAFWNNHPSLSYLFSGMFVGPTCQAPRIDEARNDLLQELEVAFAHLTRETTPAPWMVDRSFRNILVDVTGNTHRAEFCIDKLFSPDSASGRLGLLELRAFEMAPHPQMGLLQQLLVRALVAAFWETPYDFPLVRWNTMLHDRHLLPYFVWEDLKDVLENLRRQEFHFEEAWFAPQFEFRFPQYGEIARGGVHLELRGALEPWHVLGEQPGPGGTARFVDSALERVQLRVRGLVDRRHKVACNGIEVPLHPTGAAGEFVAAIRFKAWDLPNGMHPTIPVHAPLIFDLVDTWNQKSLGGCTYWPAHPGGRHYETYPVNACEAEARREARFSPIGHTPGYMNPQPAPANPEYPWTLDLRKIPAAGP
ncbi:MAG: transglutaminase family protein [Candidatus Hydrogenedentes bacterium]|nr:transglutaminase family protein [Candidatus Hydrogenedentota bacterium]